MLLAPALMGLCNHWWYHLVMLDGLHARSTIQAAVYSKLLRISNAARTKSTADGGVADTLINLQSTDCRQIEMCYWMWNYLWAAPLQVVVTTVLLYLQLGWPIFLGIAILLLLIPMQKFLMGKLKKLTLAASKASDERIKLIAEIVYGVQVVKLQAWEDLFAARVHAERAQELRQRRRLALLKGANIALAESANVLTSLVTFIAAALWADTQLTPARCGGGGRCVLLFGAAVLTEIYL